MGVVEVAITPPQRLEVEEVDLQSLISNLLTFFSRQGNGKGKAAALAQNAVAANLTALSFNHLFDNGKAQAPACLFAHGTVVRAEELGK
jgi:hypothetical protein